MNEMDITIAKYAEYCDWIDRYEYFIEEYKKHHKVKAFRTDDHAIPDFEGVSIWRQEYYCTSTFEFQSISPSFGGFLDWMKQKYLMSNKAEPKSIPSDFCFNRKVKK